MLTPDIVSLRQFYASPLGDLARGLIEAELRHLWPSAKGEDVLAIGFATPYLDGYVHQGARVSVCMPARQGAAYWPQTQNNLVLLAHESELPFAENSMNRVLLVHSIENSEQLSWMMQEVWRVLTPGGRVLAIVPNRIGFWARGSHTPFGYGRPFSIAQMRDLLAEHEFTLTRSRPALFIPPTGIKTLWKIARKIEAIGHFFCPFLGGVWLVEAEKQVYASLKQPVHMRKRYGITIPAAQPAMTSGRRFFKG
ncbi:MAG: class I SAM-dependent methyltransferase [Alphaproteobacteria bacterium]|nr:class I SAM-dependent methyltransferase [Alphaproteobacteria bacterium]